MSPTSAPGTTEHQSSSLEQQTTLLKLVGGAYSFLCMCMCVMYVYKYVRVAIGPFPCMSAILYM